MADRKQKRKKAPDSSLPEPKPVPSSQPYTLEMTATAKAVYLDLHKKSKEAEERGDATSAHCTAFRMVYEAIKFVIPAAPVDKRYALAGDLSNIYRVKKGRMRICWVASSRLRRICIIFISESLRKQGDVNDPYRVFANMVMSGQFNDVFGQLGVRIPKTPISPFEVQ
ncbi:MAG TPA: type II toxin-antitoxin system YhaV family toxin [Candidatus Angelobacter sp.]|nr:type II toxin-antitoxin system YhaV family toxin [Candidatus Angelobacter sp.]